MKDRYEYTRNKVILHIIGWVIYVIYLYSLNLLTSNDISILSVVLPLIPFIGMFYAFLYLFRKFNDNKIGGIFCIVLLLLFFIMIAYGLIRYIFPYLGLYLLVDGFNLQSFIQEIIRYFIQFFIYALLFFIVEELLRKERKVLELEKEKYILELKQLEIQKEKLQYQYAFLRAQINPHFLYNTLNVLYSQALPISDDLANNIMKVSDLMRYSLDNIELENMSIPIHKEIEHLDILLSIYKLRYSNEIYVNKNIKGEDKYHYVPPLSLITIVENAFKYGVISDANNPMLIDIIFEENALLFICKNKKRKSISNAVSHNIGLSNLEKRLNFAFENKYQIDIDNTEDFYTFKLKIYK
ncbi:sensor histidine kinase [Bergeyella zoohelcum]|uniref:Signal transduction histidine kinase internal region domain-containing protein n=2 Tax=Bergeyella zoohelcum TaxID=1015 RepID=K1LPU7_9FLAO|nr:histidine kinase [Bergeyella zoohelcum]EKB54132.1 hypothetical protein HMPREF9699_02115 [Bergeyella zoohelcum ATCC 43767]SUV65520.1 Probable sensor-like histidine kinase YehU [Bergeyella zoohelcum]VDH06574.1 Probable sensor-like histidine kinase YehU [Bergeyella zoohelcum]